MPYLHIRMTPGEGVGTLDEEDPYSDDFAARGHEAGFATLGGGR
jgi:hypothetical protein